MEYALGVDLGTTYTAAAIRTNGRVEIAQLGGRRPEIPSLVFVGADGTILIGEAAERRGATEPARLAREFKRRVGDPVSVLVGGAPYSAHALMARLLTQVLDTVSRYQEAPPSAVTVTHPANWGPYKRELLDQAVRIAELDNVTLRTEPEAAAVQYAASERVRPDETVAVYDLGGGTFDAAVLRKTTAGFTLLGEPEGIEQLGGTDFDDAVFGHVLNTLDSVVDRLDPDDDAATAALARLRRDCVEAKESLSFDTEVMIPVALPGLHTRIRLNRSEFEAMITDPLADTIAALHRALRSARITPEELRCVLLAGGSSRIPLIAQLITAEFDCPIAVDPHPEHSIALGAARVTLPGTDAATDGVPSERAPTAIGRAAIPAPPTRPTTESPAPPKPVPVPPPHRDRLAGLRRLGGRSRVLLGAGAIFVLAVIVIAFLAWPWSGGSPPPPAEAASPTVLWTLDTGRPITGRPAVVGDVLYFGSQNGKVYAVSRRDGRELWTYTTPRPIVSSPQVVGGVLYIASNDGFVYALGAERGELRWRARAGVDIMSSPAISGYALYIGSNDNNLYAFDLSGQERWRFPTRGVMWTTPAVANGLVYTGSQDGHLYAVDASTGRQRWAQQMGEVFSSPAVAEGTVFVGSNDKHMYFVNARTGQVRWKFPTFAKIGGSPLVTGGAVYFGGFDGIVYSLDARTGGERWRFTVHGAKPIFSSPDLADGVLYIGSHAGRVYALDAATGVKRWDFLTGGIVGASPRVVDGELYIGSDDGKMYAFRLPPG